jgi:hypothetical protein
MQTSIREISGYTVEIVFSGAPGWFDFYINGKPWGCAQANKLQRRIAEAIELKLKAAH